MNRRKYEKRSKEHLEYDLETHTKICGTCLERKPFSEFHNNSNSIDGYGPRCKSCDSIARKKWQENNKERSYLSSRKRNLKHKYGINIEEYEKMKKESGGCCICGTKENSSACGKNTSPNFCVDHNHDTGEIRGLLCNKCNRALGLFEDSRELLLKAIKYLGTH